MYLEKFGYGVIGEQLGGILGYCVWFSKFLYLSFLLIFDG